MSNRPASAFLGNYKFNARPVVTHAPDCVVYLNGSLLLPSCRECNTTIPINKYVQNVSVDLTVDSPPGSASISLVIPSQVGQNFYFDGNLVLTTMMEVEIYMKGFYTVDGVPRYYPVFWGLTTGVEDSFSGGEYTINISCADILHWWSTQHININPAFTHWGSHPGSGWQMFGHKFAGQNPYDIIYTLSRHVFGDIHQAARSLTGYHAGEGKDVSRNALLSNMLYWEKRFARMTQALVLYGLDGNIIRGSDIGTRFQVEDKKIVDLYHKGNKRQMGALRGGFASSLIRETSRDTGFKKLFDPASTSVAAFQTQFMNAGNIEFWESEYLSKMETAQQCAQSIGFEFYMDTTGEIVFKPPFWNLDTKPNFPTSWIRDIDIIDWGFSESESEVVNHLSMKGSWRGKISFAMGSEVQPTTSVTDYRLLRKFGWRTQDYTCDYWSNPRTLFLHGLNVMDHQNVNIHTGSITIPIRPEMRLGFPVYVEPKDSYWYVKGINHSFSRGGRCTTSLTLNARRSKFFAPKHLAQPVKKTSKNKKTGAGSLEYTAVQTSSEQEGVIGNWLDEPFILRDDKGKLIGRPNVVMVYDRGWRDLTLDAQADALGLDPTKFKGKGRKKKLKAAIQKKTREAFGAGMSDRVTFDAWLAQQQIGRTGYGLFTGGQYKFAEDPSVEETIYVGSGKGSKVKISVTTQSDRGGETTTEEKEIISFSEGHAVFPVSDAQGFEVIGNYRYGRGLMVVPTGELLRQPEQRAVNPDGVDGSFRQSVNAGFALGTGLNPGLVSAEAFVGMAPRSGEISGQSDASPGDIKGLPQTAQAESTGGAKATIPVEATKADPFAVRVDGGEKGRMIYELTPAFDDPHLGSTSTTCACSLERADIFFELAQSGGIFGFMREYLKQEIRPEFAKTTIPEPVHRYTMKNLLGGSTRGEGTKAIPTEVQENGRKTIAVMEVLHDYWAQRAKTVGTDGKPLVRIGPSGHGGYRPHTHNKNKKDRDPHQLCSALDLTVKVDGKFISREEVYAGVYALIQAGKLPDGGVGAYFKPGSSRMAGPPHYDWAPDKKHGVRKWNYIGSQDDWTTQKSYLPRPNDPDRGSVQDMLDHPERFPKGFDLAGLIAASPDASGIRSWDEWVNYRSLEDQEPAQIIGETVIGYSLPNSFDKGEILRRIEANLADLNNTRAEEHALYENQLRGLGTRFDLPPETEQAFKEFFRFSSPQPPPPTRAPRIPATPNVQTATTESLFSRLGLSLPNGVTPKALNDAYAENIGQITELSILRERIAAGVGVTDADVQSMLNLNEELKKKIAASYFEKTGETPTDMDILFVEEAVGALLQQSNTRALAAQGLLGVSP